MVSQNKYVPFGKNFELVHGRFSFFKKICFSTLFILLFIQVLTVISTNKYIFISQSKIEFSFTLLGTLVAILLVGCLAYALYFSFRILLKTLSVIVVIIIIFLFVLNLFTPLFGASESGSTLILSFIINVLIALLVHVASLCIINSILKVKKFQKSEEEKEKEKIDWKKYLFFLISPDYFFAGYYKGFLKSEIYNKEQGDSFNGFKTLNGDFIWELREQKNRLRYFIVFSNWINVSLIVSFVAFLLFVNIYDIVSFWWYNFILYLIIFRLVSRCFEVAYAFYKDVVRNKAIYLYNFSNEQKKEDKFINNWRNSAIRKPERISLAIHSYIEILLLFGIFYFFILGSTYNSPCELIDFKSEIVNEVCLKDPDNKEQIVGEQKNLIDMLLYSSSVTFFNVSYEYKYSTPFEWKLAHVSQVLVSIILIVLCLASYISFKDEMDDEEIKEYLLIKYYDKKENEEVYNKIATEGISRKPN